LKIILFKSSNNLIKNSLLKSCGSKESNDSVCNFNQDSLSSYELCVATMSIFYGQDLTQDSLKAICTLINLTGMSELPSTYNSLQNMLMKTNAFKKSYKKTFYWRKLNNVRVKYALQSK
jgi:hypothetical protein